MYFKTVAIACCKMPCLYILQTLKSYTLKRNSLLIEQIFLIDLLAPVGGTRKMSAVLALHINQSGDC